MKESSSFYPKFKNGMITWPEKDPTAVTRENLRKLKLQAREIIVKENLPWSKIKFVPEGRQNLRGKIYTRSIDALVPEIKVFTYIKSKAGIIERDLSQIKETLAHEVAHLKHFNHLPIHKEYTKFIDGQLKIK